MDYITTPHQAELNAAAQMKLWGFPDAVATTGGSDGGIDVRSRTALAQVKWKGGVVGRPDCQKLVGAAAGDTRKALVFFAASGYSRQAIEYANLVGISLFTYDPTGEVRLVNDVPLPTAPMRSWYSPDWVALLRAVVTVLRWFRPTPVGYRRRRRR